MKIFRRWRNQHGRWSLSTGSSSTTWLSTMSYRTRASSCWQRWAKRRTSRSGFPPAGYDPTPNREGGSGWGDNSTGKNVTHTPSPLPPPPNIKAAFIFVMSHFTDFWLSVNVTAAAARFRGVGRVENLNILIWSLPDLLHKSLQIPKDETELDSSPKKSFRLCLTLMQLTQPEGFTSTVWNNWSASFSSFSSPSWLFEEQTCQILLRKQSIKATFVPVDEGFHRQIFHEYNVYSGSQNHTNTSWFSALLVIFFFFNTIMILSPSIWCLHARKKSGFFCLMLYLLFIWMFFVLCVVWRSLQCIFTCQK